MITGENETRKWVGDNALAGSQIYVVYLENLIERKCFRRGCIEGGSIAGGGRDIAAS